MRGVAADKLIEAERRMEGGRESVCGEKEI